MSDQAVSVIRSTQDPRKGRYRGVLSKSLEMHYDDNDIELMNLRNKAALLEAFLKQTLSQMDKEGAGLNTVLIKDICARLYILSTLKEERDLIEAILTEIRKSDVDDILQVKARKLVQEFVEVTKASTSQLVAVGGALTLPQIAGLINGIMTIALKFMSTALHSNYDDDKERARDFIGTVRRQVVNFPGMEQLSEAANVPFTKTMGNKDCPSTGWGEILDTDG